MNNHCKVALAQIRPTLGDFETNLAQHLQYVEMASREGAKLVIFPELGLTGYQVQDMTLDIARKLDAPEIVTVIEASRKIDIVFSFVEEGTANLFYVATVYASKGALVHVHRKVYLPTYGMFDERRYFAAGRDFKCFSALDTSVGLMICEDAWHGTSPYLLALQGANLLIVPSSSPSRSVVDETYFGSQKFWRNLLHIYAQQYGMNVLFVNRVGFEDGVNFFGGSFAISAEGEWLCDAPCVDEGLFYAELDLAAPRRARFGTPIVRDERPLLVAHQLAEILKRDK